MQPEALTLWCYGVEIRLADEAGLGLCQRLRAALPPEFVAPSEPSEVAVAYVVTEVAQPSLDDASEFLVTCDEVAVFATAAEDELYWWLRHDIDLMVARRSPQLLFVHYMEMVKEGHWHPQIPGVVMATGGSGFG